MFEQGKVKDGLEVANSLVVPVLVQLSKESGDKNRVFLEDVLEKVRAEWCQCLNRPNLNEGMYI